MRKLAQTLFALVATAVLIATSACATLPRSSDIKVGPNLDTGLTSDYLYYSPVGPTEGASQVEILNAFLNAGTGPQNDYSIAREFLSEKFKSDWNPSQEVLIQRGKVEYSMYSNTRATATVEVAAQVNSKGQYETLPTGSTRLLDFEFVWENDQWRLSKAPNLTLVIQPVFDVIFRSYSIYFYDQQFEYLVPDLRWFPSRASTGTRLVNALLEGPSDWLSSAVRSAIPTGTKLSTASVTILDGTATVDLTNRALTATPKLRERAKAQISATLEQLANVYNVDIQIERTPQDIATIKPPIPAEVSMSPVALTSSGLVHLAANVNTSVIGSKQLLAQVGATDFALSYDEQFLAMLGPDGAYLAKLGQVGNNAKRIDGRGGLLAPVFDIQGFVWSSSAMVGQGVVVTDRLGKRISFNPGWLTGTDRLAFSISREGSRATVLVRTEGGTQLYVMAIERNEKSEPVRFGAPKLVLGSSAAITNASWAGEVDLAVISTRANGLAAPAITTVGGATTNLATIQGAVSIVASNGTSSVYVLSRDGTMYQYRGATWNLVQSSVSALHFPG